MDTYDAVVIPGGHGPVEDLYKDPDMGRILVRADRASKLIASGVTHSVRSSLAETQSIHSNKDSISEVSTVSSRVCSADTYGLLVSLFFFARSFFA